jgi:hypothetical protein
MYTASQIAVCEAVYIEVGGCVWCFAALCAESTRLIPGSPTAPRCVWSMVELEEELKRRNHAPLDLRGY